MAAEESDHADMDANVALTQCRRFSGSCTRVAGLARR
jgi:hypothetical protein